MRYLALATDYDGTIALHGAVDEATLHALERLRSSGRRLILVTGRELDDLLRVFPHTHIFDRIVAENGALVYHPAERTRRSLGAAPPPEFVRELVRRGVSPLSTGEVIVATWEPNEATVLEVIREFALELQVVFNKGAVMVLPTGINKATGLQAALTELSLSSHNTAGVGDAENDQAFLSMCECAVAVSNALDSVKTRVDLVTAKDHGAGVSELIDRLIEGDLGELAPLLTRHELVLGHNGEGREVRLPPFDRGVLVAGPSAAGKTTVTTAVLERLANAGYQYCLVDPEGDYGDVAGGVTLAASDPSPLVDEVMQVLGRPDQSVSANLVNIPLAERPAFFAALLPRLQEQRSRTGRPHWIVVDEAHHLMPSDWQPARLALPGELANLLLVTVHPDHIAPDALQLIDALIVVGRDAHETLSAFVSGRGALDWSVPDPLEDPPDGEMWLLGAHVEPCQFVLQPPESERRRHRRKYAEGSLGPDRSFYFRGAEGQLNLRAQNLITFAQLAEGVDDETWMHHLRQHDYSRWFREAIKDEALADDAWDVEHRGDLSPAESRDRIRAAIQQRYTTPA